MRRPEFDSRCTNSFLAPAAIRAASFVLVGRQDDFCQVGKIKTQELAPSGQGKRKIAGGFEFSVRSHNHYHEQVILGTIGSLVAREQI
jgi:hypothetical protein